jgi:hypothetical protein
VLINLLRAKLALYPTYEVSLYKLYKLFSYTNVNALYYLIALTNSLKLSNCNNFLYKVCLLSNLYKKIFYIQPNYAIRLFKRVYVNIVSSMQITSNSKE